MSIKSIVCLAAAALVASPALAQPSFTIDLVRDGGGVAVLDPNGDWQWEVSVTPDFATVYTGTDTPIGIVAGISLTGSELIASSAAANDPPYDRVNPGVAPAGFSFATGTGGIGGNLPEGIIEGTNDTPVFGAGIIDSIFAAIGSDVISAGGVALTFTTDGPASNDSLTTSASISGLISQLIDAAPGSQDFTGLSSSFSATATPGDTNLDGFIDINDLAVFGGGAFNNPTTAGFSDGDYTGDNFLDINDLAAFGGGAFNNPTASPQPVTATPEPSSLLLLVTLAAGFVARKRG